MAPAAQFNCGDSPRAAQPTYFPVSLAVPHQLRHLSPSYLSFSATLLYISCLLRRREAALILCDAARHSIAILLEQLAPSSPPTTMSHWLSHRPRTSDGNLLSPGHKVSFSDSSKHSSQKRDSDRPSSSNNSRTASPARPPPARPQSHQPRSDSRNLQRINRRSEALWQYAPPRPTASGAPLINDSPGRLLSHRKLLSPSRS